MPKLRYFLPDSENKVDPTFNFPTDTFTEGRNVAEDFYAHDIYTTPPYDGMLMSRAIVEKNRKYEFIKKVGAHKYLRLPEGLEVFGDCGAFSYVNQERPPYDTEDILEYYSSICVNYGASVDHIVVDSIKVIENVEETLEDGTVTTKQIKRKVPLSDDDREERRQLTLDNARAFIELHKQQKSKFIPVGVAQGWTTDKYADSVKNLTQMGYNYIALGGLARAQEKHIIDVIKAVKKIIDIHPKSPKIKIHIFGVAKLSIIKQLLQYGITSIDSTSYLRRSWLKSGQNYLGTDGQWYTAIRVPQSTNPRLERLINSGKSLDEIRQQEQECLSLLEEYDGQNDDADAAYLDNLLNKIIAYDNYLLRIGDDGKSLMKDHICRPKYQKTLSARPWKNCPCEICQDIGIHVIIFRGLNRNTRRGFHNTWAFYQYLKNEL